MTNKGSIEKYTSQMSTQMRKGFIAYCVLKVCSKKPVYTSDIIKELRDAKLVVVEGTIYPLLSRLQKMGFYLMSGRKASKVHPVSTIKLLNLGKR